tara:strand:+ start:149 stop:367 length:219 start_codon:yes stop_codon:yes gene_type:complete
MDLMDDDKPTLKEACRIYFLVKGHIDISDEQAFSSYNSYFRRLWFAGSDGAPLYEKEDAFEEAWRNKYKDKS